MRRVISATVGTIAGLIMLLSFKAHGIPTTAGKPPAAIGQTSATTPTMPTPPATSVSARPPTGAAGTPGAGPSATAVTATKTVTGSAAQTRYGPVQVEVTVTNGQITAVDAVAYPTSSGRDRQINARAIPQLDQEALVAQSAKVDTISGATYTSMGYRISLQSALDQAGRA